MKLFHFLACLGFIALLSGCSSIERTGLEASYTGFADQPSDTRKENWKLLVGSWYGSLETEDGGSYQWVIRRDIQGFYRLEGKITRSSGKIQSQVEIGEWGVGKEIYFSIFKGWVYGENVRPSDPTDPYNRDIYRILKLNEKSFRYQHIDSGKTYEVEKVADSFVLPDTI